MAFNYAFGASRIVRGARAFMGGVHLAGRYGVGVGSRMLRGMTPSILNAASWAKWRVLGAGRTIGLRFVDRGTLRRVAYEALRFGKVRWGRLLFDKVFIGGMRQAQVQKINAMMVGRGSSAGEEQLSVSPSGSLVQVNFTPDSRFMSDAKMQKQIDAMMGVDVNNEIGRMAVEEVKKNFIMGGRVPRGYEVNGEPVQEGKWVELGASAKAQRRRAGRPPQPLIDTGRLMNSIGFRVENGKVIVGTNVEYGKYQDRGTKTIPPRPFTTIPDDTKKKMSNVAIAAYVKEGEKNG